MQIDLDKVIAAGYEVELNRDGAIITIIPKHPMHFDIKALLDQMRALEFPEWQIDIMMETLHEKAEQFQIWNVINA